MAEKKNNLFIKLLTAILTFCIGFCCFAVPVFAQNDDGDDDFIDDTAPSLHQFKVSDYLKIEGGQTYLDSKNTEVKKSGAIAFFIIKLIKLLTTIIGSFALLFIIVGGIILMASSGNSTMQTRGKDILKFSIIGLVVTFTSLIVVTFIQSLFYAT